MAALIVKRRTAGSTREAKPRPGCSLRCEISLGILLAVDVGTAIGFEFGWEVPAAVKDGLKTEIAPKISLRGDLIIGDFLLSHAQRAQYHRRYRA